MASEFKLAPSILSADFSELGEALQLCAEGGAHYIHVDVMDNQFVPNLTIGPPVVKSLRPLTQKYMDIHMMVIEPEKLVEPFAKAGADEKPQEVIDLIRASGKDVGLSLKPKTPVADIEPFLDQIDLLLIMSVEPGFGGQGYVDGSTERVTEIKQLLIEKCLKDRVKIEVDGGIKLHNAKEVLDAGADILVVGSEVFKAEDPVGMMRSFYELANS